MDYRNRIIELRKENGLSQLQLAKKLNISQSAVAKWESKRTEPTATAIIALSKIFNKSTDYILGLEDEWGNKLNNTKIEET